MEYLPGGDVFIATYTDDTSEQLTHAEVLKRLVGLPHRGNLFQSSPLFTGDVDYDDTQSQIDPTDG